MNTYALTLIGGTIHIAASENDCKRLVHELQSHNDEVMRLRDAMHEISLCSQNSTSSKDECGRIARRALCASNEGEELDDHKPHSEQQREREIGILLGVSASLRADNQRLRAALNEIACAYKHPEVQHIVRVALKGGE